MGETQLDLLERLLARLDQYAKSITRIELETDLDAWLKVTRALELVAQCCIDLAIEVIAQRKLGLPESYRDAFSRLAQDGVITGEHAAVLQSWAGLRNVLAHLYGVIDLDRLHAALCEDKAAIRDFARIAARELADAP